MGAYFVDAHKLRVGDVLATVPKAIGHIEDSCCDMRSYYAEMSTVPLHHAVAGVMVVPVDLNGIEMPLGKIAPLADVIVTTTFTSTTLTTLRPKANVAQYRSSLSMAP